VPAQVSKRRAGLKGTPRQGIPQPGTGGYAYPPGPFGATGYRGSTSAAAPTHSQGRDGRKDPQYQGRPTLNATSIRARDTGPEFDDVSVWAVPKPQPSPSQHEFTPGTEAENGNRYLRRDGTPRQPFARQKRSTSSERRMTPIIGANAPGSQNVRNTIAQRYKADPSKVREYKPAPNPGKTGAHLNGKSQYHPDQQVYGQPGGKPIPGMDSTTANDNPVTVQSRYVSHEGAQEGYAMNRDLAFTKGGKPAGYPATYEGVRHLRGGRLTGNRYFGEIDEQQQIGLPSDSYGIARKRGPRHRPVKFEVPAPWSANYYDLPPHEGTQSPDMIRRSPGGGRRASTRVRRGGGGGRARARK